MPAPACLPALAPRLRGEGGSAGVRPERGQDKGRPRIGLVQRGVAGFPPRATVSSHTDALTPDITSAPVTLTATAAVNSGAGTWSLTPVADDEVASGSPTSNCGTTINLYVQSATSARRHRVARPHGGLFKRQPVGGHRLGQYNDPARGRVRPTSPRRRQGTTTTLPRRRSASPSPSTRMGRGRATLRTLACRFGR